MKKLFLSLFLMVGVFINAAISAPSIVSVSPGKNASNVNRDSQILISFSEAMDQNTLGTTTIFVQGSQSGKITWNGSYNSSSNEYSLTPETNFKAGEIITVTLTTGIKNAGGSAVAKHFVWTFTIKTSPVGSYDTVNGNPSVSFDVQYPLVADLDGDQLPDLIMPSINNNSSIYKNNGDKTFTSMGTLSSSSGSSYFVAADLDLDGKVDLINDNFKVYRNLGSFTFEDKGGFSGGGSQVAVADINGDGLFDLLSTDSFDDQLVVRLNTGSFTFGNIVEYTTESGPHGIAIGDFNEDGSIDVVVANYDYNITNDISIFYNNGDGTFGGRVNINTQDPNYAQYGYRSSPYTVNVGDVNNDSHLDIVVSNFGPYKSLAILKNDGTGSFSKTNVEATLSYSMQTIDLNGDGKLEILKEGSSTTSYSLSNDGNGNFSSGPNYTFGSNVSRLTTADLDGNGSLSIIGTDGSSISILYAKPPEIVLAQTFPSANSNTHHVSDSISVTFNQAMNVSSFTSASFDVRGEIKGKYSGTITSGLSDKAILFKPDQNFIHNELITVTLYTTIVSALNIALPDTIVWKFTTEKSPYPAPTITSVSPGSNSFGASKTTNIGVTFSQDMLQSTLTNSNVRIIGSQSGFHTSAFSFNHSTKELTINPDTDFRVGEQVTVTVKTKVKNVYNDTLSHFYSWNFSIANGEASGTFNAKTDYVAGKNPKGVSLADFDKDGDLDMSITNGAYDAGAGNYIFSILMNNNDGTFASPAKYSGTYQTSGSTTADFNDDGYMDIAHVSYGASSAIVSLNNGDGTFGAIEFYTVASGPISVNSADLDGDGDIDLVVSTLSTNISILLNDGSGVFSAPQNLAVSSGNYFLTIADFDNDGDLDIAATTELNTMGVFINNGNLSFASPVYYNAGTGSSKIASGDFNNDGYCDILVANDSGNSISVFINNENGTFADKVDYATGAGPNFLTVADFNNDGSLDAVIGTSAATDGLSVLFNVANGTFPSAVKYQSGAYPFGSNSGDLNNDGVLDLVVVFPGADNLSVFIGNKESNPSSGTYANISFTSPTTLTGNLEVSGNLAVSSQITTGGNTINLGTTGSLSGETPANYIVGTIQTTRDLSTSQSNIAGLGISIDPQTNNLGNTTIKRETGSSVNAGAVKQVWTITPETQPSGPVSVTLTWPSTNDNSINLNDLVVYKSSDGGDTWNVVSAVINKDTDPRTATFTITSFSIFTIGESAQPLPVELSSFTAVIAGDGVKLNWSTTTETTNSGWEIEQRLTVTGETGLFRKVGFVAGKGTTTEAQTYSFAVSGVKANLAEFRLKQIDMDGKSTYSQILSVEVKPSIFELSQNYPNPFNPSTTIRYAVAEEGRVSLTLYNALGQKLKTLVQENQPAGFYSVQLNAANLTSGVYFYVLEAGSFKSVKKLTLLK